MDEFTYEITMTVNTTYGADEIDDVIDELMLVPENEFVDCDHFEVEEVEITLNDE